ncbi:P26a [Urbanus proteus nucleopolyhedrovirus]|uniref:P26a n=1 Tax=Urbanus proteus nucleopolyhedrovirus TaxID=1675866 RepID=A0A162GTQ8_9ABAC|nr:P26a [Urbanus proteus nucleopolyhedrovirus]AKR17288.2 P26a [Urbanus proteus nucleopolyhedrovirus]
MCCTKQIAVLLFLCAAAAHSKVHLNAYRVKCSVDHDTKKIDIDQINGQNYNFVVVPPHQETTASDLFDYYHQFPGLVTDYNFHSFNINDTLKVLLSDGKFLHVLAHDKVLFNFHVHKNRMIFGQMVSFSVNDRSIASKIYVGAPVFRALDHKLVSVITCNELVHKTDGERVIFPLTGVRHEHLSSGHVSFDGEYVVSQKVHGLSIYGRQQLPYTNNELYHTNVKQYAINIMNNQRVYRNDPRTVTVYYDDEEIDLVLTEGEFEIMRFRIDGGLVNAIQNISKI